jgi:hypothetical protein
MISLPHKFYIRDQAQLQIRDIHVAMRLQSFLVNIKRSKTMLSLASLVNLSETRTLAQSSIPIISILRCPFSSMKQSPTTSRLVNQNPSVLFLPILDVNQEGLESVVFEQQQRMLKMRVINRVEIRAGRVGHRPLYRPARQYPLPEASPVWSDTTKVVRISSFVTSRSTIRAHLSGTDRDLRRVSEIAPAQLSSFPISVISPSLIGMSAPAACPLQAMFLLQLKANPVVYHLY